MKEQKKVFHHARVGNADVSAIAKQKMVLGVPHKELKSHVLRVKKPHVVYEPPFAHPCCQFDCKINDVAAGPLKITITVIHCSQNI